MSCSDPRQPQLPPDTCVVCDGRIVEWTEYTLWNGEPFPTLVITRLDGDQCRATMGDPEHGGTTRDGNLEDLLLGLHENCYGQYLALFALMNADRFKVEKIAGERNQRSITYQ